MRIEEKEELEACALSSEETDANGYMQKLQRQASDAAKIRAFKTFRERVWNVIRRTDLNTKKRKLPKILVENLEIAGNEEMKDENDMRLNRIFSQVCSETDPKASL